MSLKEYERKRDFRKSPEPRGRPRRRKAGALAFVVQKHAARRLHYDFRLELEGVLKSWAVPKGPSRDPGERRLAVHVEDHPLDYGGFEGVIPPGEYGGGTVQLWDRGTWEPEGDPAAAYRRGRLHFTLNGSRLRGRWTLVRTGRRGEEGENWLLMKSDDEYADPAWRDEDDSASVATNRTLAQIAAAPERTWSSGGAREEALTHGTPAALPEALKPQLATAVEQPPEGDGWLHEIKFDGYRVMARLSDGKARLISRSGQDWTRRFGSVARAVAALPAREAWLDGEVSVLRADGTTSFQGLQEAISAEQDTELVYFLFDLPFLDGRDLRGLPLQERKAALKRLLAADTATASPLRFSDHVAGHGRTFFEQACAHRLEGTVAKRADAPYRSTRSRDWQKVKCQQRQEFIVGGYTAPRGGRTGFGALLIGYRDDAGELVYAGKVGTGFDERTLRTLTGRLAATRREMPPFTRGPIPRQATWVEPELVAEVRFAEWTREGVLRMPAFLGLREDKPAREVRQERPDAPEPDAPDTGAPPATDLPDRVAGLRLSNPDKVLFPAQGLTKRDLARYYEAVADWILPELAHRPLTLLRCPEGRHKPCFFQKHVMPGLPPGLHAIPIPEKGKDEDYLYLTSIEGVIGLVQMGVLEIHTWGAHVDRVERPDRIVFDLDPDEGLPWARVVAAAHRLRALLTDLGLESFARTTGGKGLHVVVPVARRHDWDTVKAFAKAVVARLAHEEPRAYTISPVKRSRAGKIFLDYLRNARGATAIASYSTRAREGAPVAVNLAWDEVTEALQPTRFTVATVPARLREQGTDPWHAIPEVGQSITSTACRHLAL